MLKRLNLWKNNLDSFDIISFIILTIFTLLLVDRNLLFSTEFELLGLREIDDLAFQITLRKCHEFFEKGHFQSLFGVVDYCYGNLFWLVNTIITFPFYKWHNEVAVMFIPRFLSQMLFGFSGYIVYKVSKTLTSNKYMPIVLMIIALSSPALVYAAQRFHTHAYLVALGAGIFYLAIDGINQQRWRYIFFLSGVSVGIKLTGLFYVPFVGFYYFISNGYFSSLLNKKFLKLIAIWSGGLFIGLSPLFFLPFLFRADINHILKIIEEYFQFSSEVFGTPDLINPWFLFSNGFGSFLYPLGFLGFFLLGWLLLIFYNKNSFDKKLLVSFFISFLMASIYLIFRTGQGPWAISNYILPFAILWPLGLLGYQRFIQNTHILNSSLLILILLLAYTQSENMRQAWQIYPEKMSSKETNEKIQSYNDLKSIIAPINGKLSILKDYRLPVPFTVFKEGTQSRDMFDNLQSFEIEPTFDYLVLSKKSLCFASDEELETMVNKKDLFLCKNLVKNLLSTKTLFGKAYTEIYNRSDILAYKRKY